MKSIQESLIYFLRSLTLTFVIILAVRSFRIIYEADFQFSLKVWVELLDNLLVGIIVVIGLSIIFFIYLLLRARFYKPKNSK